MAKCLCGCNQEVTEGKRFVNASHWRTWRKSQGEKAVKTKNPESESDEVIVSMVNPHWKDPDNSSVHAAAEISGDIADRKDSVPVPDAAVINLEDIKSEPEIEKPGRYPKMPLKAKIGGIIALIFIVISLVLKFELIQWR